MKNTDIKKIIAQLIIQDAVADEIIFDDLEAPDIPSIGDYAHDSNNQPVDGKVLLPTGDVYRFNKGKLVEILMDDSIVSKYEAMLKEGAAEIKAYTEKESAKLTAYVKSECRQIRKILGIKD